MSFRSHIFLLAFGLIFAEIGAIPFSPDPAYFDGLRGMEGTTGYSEILLPITQYHQYHSRGRRFENEPPLESPHKGRIRILGKRTSKKTPNEGRDNQRIQFN